MTICSNCQATVVEASPYRETVMPPQTLEAKRSLMSRIHISPRTKTITLITIGSLIAIGIPAYCFHSIALMILLGVLGLIGALIVIILALLLFYFLPDMVGVWLARKFRYDNWFINRDYINGDLHPDTIGPWWLAMGVFVAAPAGISIAGYILFLFGKLIAMEFGL